jgi:predicted house-cleaning noncanonical NTP pyrophosphatase (MazG superfamily)
MKKIWNDPVFSKVIAGIFLALLGVIGATLWKWMSLPSDERSLSVMDFSATIEINKFIVIFVLLFLVGIMITVIAKSRFKKYDLFFSAPMSFATDEEYKKVRKDSLKLIEQIKKYTPYQKIYYAAESIEGITDFSTANHAATDDLEALRNSKKFLLYLPKKLPSSAIFEAGYAFRKNLSTVYFCHDDDDFPFLLKDLNDSFRSVRKYEGATLEQLCLYVQNHGKKLFSKSI